MRIAAIIIILIAFVACKPKPKQSSLPFFNSADLTPEWINIDSPNYKSVHTIPAFSFTDQNNTTITNKTVEGKIYVADFFFVQCASICPKMTSNMNKIANAFANDANVVLLSHTVMPESDSISVLKEYAVVKKITNSNWHLLTGNKESIYTIARKAYFADEKLGYNKDVNEFLHTENFILVDAHGRIRGIYNGTIDLEVNDIIKHIKELKASGE